MENITTNQLFDKVFKRIIRLSSRSIVSFINGLFDKDFPLNSDVTYYSTENIKDNLEKSISDSIITINHEEKFLIESQINDDNSMVLRIFDYGYYEAVKGKVIQDGKIIIKVANPRVIYLEHTNSTPDELTLEIIFSHQESFTFRVPTMKFLNYTIDELNNKNMVILMPLYLLKLRKEIRKNQSKENADKLKELLNNGLIKSIKTNEANKNITLEDSRVLIELLNKLYDELYGSIKFFKEEGVSKMLDDMLILQTDVAKEEGLKEGLKEGKIEKAKEIAAKMLKINMPIEEITKLTELPIAEIEKLKNALK